MKFIQSLVLLVVAFFALSSASNLTGFNVNDTTQKCTFSLPANGTCTSSAKCGATSSSTYAYSITATKGASNSLNYTITGFSDAKCTPVANNLFTNTFICNPNKPVSVKVNSNAVNITCTESQDSSSGSITMISFVVLIGALLASLL